MRRMWALAVGLAAIIGVAVLGRAPRAGAMSEGIVVTKATQAQVGLNFTMEAVRVSDTAVLVHMTIPKKGKLERLKRVTLSIGSGNGSPEVSADLETEAEKDDAMEVRFQVSPALAEKCSIDLVTISPTATLSNTFFYAVELKGYVVERK